MVLYLDRTEPFDIEDPVEIPGFGQIHGNVIDDAVTRGIYAYNTGGAGYALASYGEGLKFMIAQKNWRSTDAADLLAFLHRQVLASCGTILNHMYEQYSNMEVLQHA